MVLRTVIPSFQTTCVVITMVADVLSQNRLRLAWWRHRMETFSPSPGDWPFVRGIHRSPVDSPHKGQWRGALMFSLNSASTKRLNKQSRYRRFETPSCSLWRHCYVRSHSTCKAFRHLNKLVRGRSETRWSLCHWWVYFLTVITLCAVCCLCCSSIMLIRHYGRDKTRPNFTKKSPAGFRFNIR